MLRAIADIQHEYNNLSAQLGQTLFLAEVQKAALVNRISELRREYDVVKAHEAAVAAENS